MASSKDGGGGQMVGEYRMGHEIGRGSFAVVFKGHHMTNKKQLSAIKVVSRNKLSQKLLENLESEIKILKRLHHPHIVALNDCRKTDKHIFLIMEFCSVGDLSVVIKKRDRLASVHPCMEEITRLYPSPPGGGLHEVLVRHFLKQLTSALEFLRKDGLVHRDVKPQNLLLNPPPDYEAQFGANGNMEGSIMLVGLSNLPVLKLADFGFARVLPAASMAETLCGSPLYMAPEILRYEKYDATADLWSVGTVAYEAIVGKAPFRAPNHVDLLRKIEAKQDKIEFPSAVNVSEELQHLIKALLKRSPVDRMSFEELFAHPVIVKPIPKGGFQQISRSVPKPASAPPMARTPSIPKRTDPRTQPIERDARAAKEKETPPSSSRNRQMAPVENSQLPFATQLDMPNGTPPRLSDIRRYTTGTSIPNSTSPVRERQPSRPSIPHTTSAPVRDEPPRRPLAGEYTRTPSRRPPANLKSSTDEDYVIVDKQHVQVNAFADELASARRGGMTPPATTLVRRLSRPDTSPRPLPHSPSSPIHPSSYERRYGTSPASDPRAKSTIARALELAQLRLPQGLFSTPPPSPKLLTPVPSPGPDLTPSDLSAVTKIEASASRADVVYMFAEVKYAQILPTAGSSASDLTPDATVHAAEECLVLFVKTLSLLTRATSDASAWWASAPSRPAAALRMNTVVQWLRERFNAVLAKAAIVQRRIQDAQRALDTSHPWHPANHSAAAQGERDCFMLTTGASAEKLMYDRALEMSRASAVNELVGEDLSGCERGYVTALRLLEAVLEGEEEGELEVEDRKRIENFLQHIRTRLVAIGKKLTGDMALAPVLA